MGSWRWAGCTTPTATISPRWCGWAAMVATTRPSAPITTGGRSTSEPRTMVNQPHLDERHHPARALAVAPVLVLGRRRRREGERRERARLGQPPGLNDTHAVPLLERAHQGQW